MGLFQPFDCCFALLKDFSKLLVDFIAGFFSKPIFRIEVRIAVSFISKWNHESWQSVLLLDMIRDIAKLHRFFRWFGSFSLTIWKFYLWLWWVNLDWFTKELLRRPYVNNDLRFICYNDLWVRYLLFNTCNGSKRIRESLIYGSTDRKIIFWADIGTWEIFIVGGGQTVLFLIFLSLFSRLIFVFFSLLLEEDLIKQIIILFSKFITFFLYGNLPLENFACFYGGFSIERYFCLGSCRFFFWGWFHWLFFWFIKDERNFILRIFLSDFEVILTGLVHFRDTFIIWQIKCDLL